MPFESILGHKVQISRLKGLCKNGRLAHAYLFAGPPGIGKRAVATDFAALIGADITLLERLEDKREISVDQVREIQRSLSFKTAAGKMRAVMIDEAERLNDEGMNALLKTLEEPPDRCMFILVTASPALLLPTIVSRCHTVLFFPLTDAEMKIYLKTLGSDSEWITALAAGSPGRAKELADEIKDLKIRAKDLFDNVAASWLNPVIEQLSKIRETENARQRAREYLGLVMLALRESLRARELGRIANPHLLPDAMKKRLALLDSEELADRIRSLMDHLRFIDSNANVALTVEDALLRI